MQKNCGLFIPFAIDCSVFVSWKITWQNHRKPLLLQVVGGMDAPSLSCPHVKRGIDQLGQPHAPSLPRHAHGPINR